MLASVLFAPLCVDIYDMMYVLFGEQLCVGICDACVCTVLDVCDASVCTIWLTVMC